MARAVPLLCLLLAALALAACGGDDGDDGPDPAPAPTQEAALCGIDPAEWEEALDAAAAEQGDGDPAHALANDMVDSGCLVGAPRADVVAALGGDGSTYFLGARSFGIDFDSLELTYDDGNRVTEARVVQG